MWEGYLAIGGTEVLNGSRAYGYARTSGCISWLTDEHAAPALRNILDDEEYDVARISDAPWYDEDDPASTRFFGAYPVEFSNILESTRTISITQNTGDGATSSGVRRASKKPRIRAYLVAMDLESIEYGLTWLTRAVETRGCGMHIGECGVTDAVFLTDVPRERVADETDEDYAAYVHDLWRHLHGVVAVSSPRILEQHERSGAIGMLVEFDLSVLRPYVYSSPVDVVFPPLSPVVVEDTPYNLVVRPSAELGGDPVAIATNYSQNPSVEVDATGWAATSGTLTRAALTSGRTTELAAHGGASFRARLLADGVAPTLTTPQTSLEIWHTIDLSDVDMTVAQFQAQIWAGIRKTGNFTRNQMNALILWETAAGVQVGDATGFGIEVPTGQEDGFVFSGPVSPSSGDLTTIKRARIRVRCQFAYAASADPAINSDIRLYADAALLAIQ